MFILETTALFFAEYYYGIQYAYILFTKQVFFSFFAEYCWIQYVRRYLKTLTSLLKTFLF